MLPCARTLSGPRQHYARAFSRYVPAAAYGPARCPVVASNRKCSARLKQCDRNIRAAAADAANSEQLPEAAAAAPEAVAETGEADRRSCGSKTVAGLQQALQQAQLQVDQQLQQGVDLEWGGDLSEVQQSAPVKGPSAWSAAASTDASKEDSRRYPYHRRLHGAAKLGDPAAEAAVASMEEAGLPPGPRAYHMLVCSYLKRLILPGALAVKGRAAAAGAAAFLKRCGRKTRTAAADVANSEQLPEAAAAASAAGADTGEADRRSCSGNAAAESQQVLQQAQHQLDQQLQQGVDLDRGGDLSAVQQSASAKGPSAWSAAASTDASEQDSRRFPYHRRLHDAVKLGDPAAAEAAVASMQEAGLPPGPRAYHMLVCSFLKRLILPGALAVKGRAAAAGVQLLPETYATLIHYHLTSDAARPSKVAEAKALYGTLPGSGVELQLPWAVLCRLLADEGFDRDAVAAVRGGLAAGLQLDEDVAETYFRALRFTLEKGDAAAVLKVLETAQSCHGFTPEARHVTAAVAAVGRGGAADAAFLLIEIAAARGWGMDADTFRAPLSRLVLELEEAVVYKMQQPPAWLVSRFLEVGPRMLQAGVQPDSLTLAYQAEGYTLLRDARSAMAAIHGMRTTLTARGCRGCCQLLDRRPLMMLLTLLSELPMDLLQLLVYLDEDSYNLGKRECFFEADAEGCTLLSRWVAGRLKGMAAGAEALEATSSKSMADPELQFINGVAIGQGQCVVDDDGQVVPVSECSMEQLRAEAKARGLARAAVMFPSELQDAIKAARAQLPVNVLKAQVTSARARQANKAAAAPAAVGKRTGARAFYEEQWGVSLTLCLDGEDMFTGFAPLLPGVEGEAEEGEQGGKDWWAMTQISEAVAWCHGCEFSTHYLKGYHQLLMMEAQHIDTQQANRKAGMDIAMDIVRAAARCGCNVTAADVLILAAGAQAERNPAAAAAVAARMTVLLQRDAVDYRTGQRYSREFVLQQYEQLADMCLRARAPWYADAVLEAAEKEQLRPSPEIMQRLVLALGGKPRRSEARAASLPAQPEQLRRRKSNKRAR